MYDIFQQFESSDDKGPCLNEFEKLMSPHRSMASLEFSAHFIKI